MDSGLDPASEEVGVLARKSAALIMKPGLWEYMGQASAASFRMLQAQQTGTKKGAAGRSATPRLFDGGGD